MSWNLPDDCTDEMIDRAAGGYDESEPEDPDNKPPDFIAFQSSLPGPQPEAPEPDDCPF